MYIQYKQLVTIEIAGFLSQIIIFNIGKIFLFFYNNLIFYNNLKKIVYINIFKLKLNILS